MTVSIKESVSLPVGDLSNAESCTDLFQEVPELTYRRGEKLFFGSSFEVYLVVRGIVRLSSWHGEKELLEDYFHAGELVNCGVLLGPPPGNQVAAAMTHRVAIRRVSGAFFRRVLQSNGKLQREVLANLYASLNRSRDRLYRYSLLNARQRVIDFLVRYAERSGRRVGYEHLIKPVPTHQEMGDIAGTARQTVNTVLNELRAEGLVHFNRRYLIIRDLGALKEQV